MRRLWKGERLRAIQVAGLLAAFAGLGGLLLPGVSAPPALGAALMLFAGISWGIYSLRGRGAGDPTAVTAGNFLRAVPFAALGGVAFLGEPLTLRLVLSSAAILGGVAMVTGAAQGHNARTTPGRSP